MAVHRVRRTKLDTRSLADSRRPAFLACRSWSRRAPSSGRPQRPEPPRTVDFARLVVNKPWGREHLLYRNRFAGVWALHLRRAGKTSLHCHPAKKTGLIVLEGTAVLSTLTSSFQLEALEGVILEPGVFHSTEANSRRSVRILEIETPPLKYDLVRLRDEYGRAGTQYEDSSCMRPRRTAHWLLPTLTRPGTRRRPYGRFWLEVRKIRGSYSSADRTALRLSPLVVVLEGDVRSRDGRILIALADIVPSADYLKDIDSHKLRDLTLLTLRPAGSSSGGGENR